MASLLVRVLALALGLAGLPAAAGPAAGQAGDAGRPGPTVLRDIAHPGAPAGDRRRSLDLYLPAAPPAGGGQPPLLIFVHGGFWQLDDDEYRIGPALAGALVREGVAVALVRYRLAPAARHPAAAEDVAAAVAFLLGAAGRYGYDPGRVVLSGHSAGGHLAALVALDPRYLAGHRASPAGLAGVIAFSGLYDLSPRPGISDQQRAATAAAFGADPAVLARASPVRHVRRDAPPFLVLGAQDDFDGFLADARRFAEALERTGHRRADRWIIAGRDHFTLMRLDDPDNDARALVLDFLKVAPLSGDARLLAEARRRWRDPPLSTAPLWRHPGLVRSHPVDRRFVARLLPLFGPGRFELLAWPLERFHAIDLFTLLQALPAERVGRGDHLVITNLRGEKQFWRRAAIAPYQPVVVVGLDDERNLFRLGVFYRARQEYSWQPGPQPPLMARPLGAFIHFLKEPPPEITVQSSQYGLTEDSFRLAAADPLAPLRDVPRELLEVLTFRNGCVHCHTLRGVGARAHHVTAEQGAPHGGRALPLEDYPPEVWRTFVFDHAAAARAIGTTPNPVAPALQQPLWELVTRARR